MKKALITGIAGQDGSYLAELLLSKGYAVFGLAREKDALKKNVTSDVQVLAGDLEDHDSLKVAVNTAVPDEVYNLGGVSDLKTAFEEPQKTFDINYTSVGVLLGASLAANKNVRFLQASSSEIFLPSASPLNEDSERDWGTDNPYAKAKMMADRDFVMNLRTEKGASVCSAILFNHESPRRSERSVIRKITRALSKIKRGEETPLHIGNLDMRRDWGFAGDYVLAMWQMLQLEQPGDMVIATGELHSVKDVIDAAAHVLDIQLSWHGEGMHAYATDSAGKKIVEVVPDFYKPTETYFKTGDIRKAKRMMGWEPKVGFEELVEMMVRADLASIGHGK